MYFCEPCRVKNDWPASFMTSRGNCEVCGKVASCHDVPGSRLPQGKAQVAPPEKPAKDSAVYSTNKPFCFVARDEFGRENKLWTLMDNGRFYELREDGKLLGEATPADLQGETGEFLTHAELVARMTKIAEDSLARPILSEIIGKQIQRCDTLIWMAENIVLSPEIGGLKRVVNSMRAELMGVYRKLGGTEFAPESSEEDIKRAIFEATALPKMAGKVGSQYAVFPEDRNSQTAENLRRNLREVAGGKAIAQAAPKPTPEVLPIEWKTPQGKAFQDHVTGCTLCSMGSLLQGFCCETGRNLFDAIQMAETKAEIKPDKADAGYMDFGYAWTYSGTPGTKWRVSYNKETGALIACPNILGSGETCVFGRIPDREKLELILADWPEDMHEKDSLDYLIKTVSDMGYGYTSEKIAFPLD